MPARRRAAPPVPRPAPLRAAAIGLAAVAGAAVVLVDPWRLAGRIDASPLALAAVWLEASVAVVLVHLAAGPLLDVAVAWHRDAPAGAATRPREAGGGDGDLGSFGFGDCDGGDGGGCD